MANLTVNALMPFVPAKDYALSRRFYRALGFTETFSDGGVTGFRLESARFILQDFYNRELADNFMLTLMVDDVEAWWQHLEAAQLPDDYPGVKVKAPEDYPWGLREVHLIDPAGVCWHIAQPIPGTR
jgi:hypothetical protein